MLLSPEGRMRSARIDILWRNIHSIEKKQSATRLNVWPMILKPEKTPFGIKGVSLLKQCIRMKRKPSTINVLKFLHIRSFPKWRSFTNAWCRSLPNSKFIRKKPDQRRNRGLKRFSFTAPMISGRINLRRGNSSWKLRGELIRDSIRYLFPWMHSRKTHGCL